MLVKAPSWEKRGKQSFPHSSTFPCADMVIPLAFSIGTMYLAPFNFRTTLKKQKWDIPWHDYVFYYTRPIWKQKNFLWYSCDTAYSCFAWSPKFSAVLLELTKRVDNNALINAYSIWTVCVIHGTLGMVLIYCVWSWPTSLIITHGKKPVAFVKR